MLTFHNKEVNIPSSQLMMTNDYHNSKLYYKLNTITLMAMIR